LSYAEDKKLIVNQHKNPLDTLIDETDNRRILEMCSCLPETQKRRFVAHYIDEKTFRAIASEEGVNHTKIQKSIEQARKKLKKFFK
jgi:RNA polymerase sigma factor (sigma-70 family)